MSLILLNFERHILFSLNLCNFFILLQHQERKPWLWILDKQEKNFHAYFYYFHVFQNEYHKINPSSKNFSLNSFMEIHLIHK